MAQYLIGVVVGFHQYCTQVWKLASFPSYTQRCYPEVVFFGTWYIGIEEAT
jgi:hypothetical protein